MGALRRTRGPIRLDGTAARRRRPTGSAGSKVTSSGSIPSTARPQCRNGRNRGPKSSSRSLPASVLADHELRRQCGCAIDARPWALKARRRGWGDRHAPGPHAPRRSFRAVVSSVGDASSACGVPETAITHFLCALAGQYSPRLTTAEVLQSAKRQHQTEPAEKRCIESTSWGSLVRAQYRPCEKDPQKRVFLFSSSASRRGPSACAVPEILRPPFDVRIDKPLPPVALDVIAHPSLLFGQRQPLRRLPFSADGVTP
jgi:hypothetical protein